MAYWADELAIMVRRTMLSATIDTTMAPHATSISLLIDDEIDEAFCCLGTTIGKAGSKEKFRSAIGWESGPPELVTRRSQQLFIAQTAPILRLQSTGAPQARGNRTQEAVDHRQLEQ